MNIYHNWRIWEDHGKPLCCKVYRCSRKISHFFCSKIKPVVRHLIGIFRKKMKICYHIQSKQSKADSKFRNVKNVKKSKHLGIVAIW